MEETERLLLSIETAPASDSWGSLGYWRSGTTRRTEPFALGRRPTTL
jgi:hypothetical protein